MVGWFGNILIAPLETLLPQWGVVIKHIGKLGIAVALLAALSLLFKPSELGDSTGRGGAA